MIDLDIPSAHFGTTASHARSLSAESESNGKSFAQSNEECIVWLHHCVGHLWRWNHGKCFHDAIWIFFAHFGDQQCSHASASAAAKRVAKLESL